MGRLFLVHLEGKLYSCKHCRTHLALSEDIISKSFQCRHGKAYLFRKVANVTIGEKDDRMMMTGLHTVADIFCVGFGSIVGWRYFKISGPDGSSYWPRRATHALVSGSDLDDT